MNFIKRSALTLVYGALLITLFAVLSHYVWELLEIDPEHKSTGVLWITIALTALLLVTTAQGAIDLMLKTKKSTVFAVFHFILFSTVLLIMANFVRPYVLELSTTLWHSIVGVVIFLLYIIRRKEGPAHFLRSLGVSGIILAIVLLILDTPEAFFKDGFREIELMLAGIFFLFQIATGSVLSFYRNRDEQNLGYYANT